MILDNEFSGDLRVENEVYSLKKAGLEVSVLCLTHGSKPIHETFHGADIIRIPVSLFRKNKMKGLANTPFDIWTRWWARRIVKFVKEHSITALHAHDLNMLPTAFLARKKLKQPLPVIGDLHENYPAALKHYSFTQTFPGKYIVSIPKWEQSEVQWVKEADHIITVIEEATERYGRLGADTNKISVIGNYVNEDLFLDTQFDQEVIKRYAGKFVVSYAGGFDIHRGLEGIIRGLPLLKDSVPNLLLVLIGQGRNQEDLKQLAQKLGVGNHIEFTGWQKPQSLPSYFKASNLCLIPHLKTEHTDNTIPHKLFQYMLLEKPVISSNCKPLERILLETKAGLVYPSDDSAAFAEQVNYAVKHPDELNQMGRNGKEAVISKYNWDHTAQNLISIYKNLGS